MRNAVMFITVVLVTISTGAFASIENVSDSGAFNWNSGDDFSNFNYSVNNWDVDVSSGIIFGINADDEYGYLVGDYTYSYVDGEIVPTQSSDICGIRADVRLDSLAMPSGSAAYYGLGFDLNPYSSLYWGFSVLNGKLEGVLLLRQFTGTSVLHGDADFDAVVGQTYNLAIVFDEAAKQYSLYLNGEEKTNVYFPDNETSFRSGHLRMSTKKTYSRFEFDNVEYATVPEPITLFLLGLGGLMIRKYTFKGEK